MFHTKSGEQVATSFVRTVHGGRGSYHEFLAEHMIKEALFMPESTKWRIASCKEGRAFYLEYRTKADNVKVYYQRKLVTYADYKLRKCYISVYDVTRK